MVYFIIIRLKSLVQSPDIFISIEHHQFNSKFQMKDLTSTELSVYDNKNRQLNNASVPSLISISAD